MNSDPTESIQQYQECLIETIDTWSFRHQLALAASLAEHWIGAYQQFSDDENWGDVQPLKAGVQCVWDEVLSRPTKKSERKRIQNAIDDVTPHLDDFDAIEALMACVVVNSALSACDEPEQTGREVADMLIAVLENLPVEEWPQDEDEQAALWNCDLIQDEVSAQLQLVEWVEAVKAFDAQSTAELRHRAGGLVVQKQPRSEPLGVTNREIFDRYCNLIQTNIDEQDPPIDDASSDSYMTALTYFGVWLSRYMTRLRLCKGEWGRMKDQVGVTALLRMNLESDSVSGRPDWDEQAEEMLGMCLTNNESAGTVDVGDLFAPHAYGPSLRRLWLEGRMRGDPDGWRCISEWALRRPSSTGTSPPSSVDLDRAMTRNVTWRSGLDSSRPWLSSVDGQQWVIRLNDFPEEPMYGLLIDDRLVANFHDWPASWSR